jgi:hypothetical protein
VVTQNRAKVAQWALGSTPGSGLGSHDTGNWNSTRSDARSMTLPVGWFLGTTFRTKLPFNIAMNIDMWHVSMCKNYMVFTSYQKVWDIQSGFYPHAHKSLHLQCGCSIGLAFLPSRSVWTLTEIDCTLGLQFRSLRLELEGISSIATCGRHCEWQRGMEACPIDRPSLHARQQSGMVPHIEVLAFLWLESVELLWVEKPWDT